MRQQREDDLRELQEILHREQYERHRAEEEDHFDALDGFGEFADEDHPGDDDPYAQ